MNHRFKTKILKILSVFPDSLGYSLYHFLQNLVGRETFENKLQSTKNTYTTIVRILNDHNINLNDLKIIELGSGWVPILPYQLILEGGAKQVCTYDINEHYNEREINKVNDYYAKFHDLDLRENNKYQLHHNVNYYPKTNICDGNLDDADLIVSRFVLEHVSPVEIEKMHDFFSSNLKSEAFILHLISPSDHRAYSDSSLSLQDFLKYSNEEWDKIQTKFDYHNRLRLPQYLALFEKKFDIVYIEHDKIKSESVAYNKFKQLQIHKDFIKFNEQELMAGGINILLKIK